jgi:hypothetical protein
MSKDQQKQAVRVARIEICSRVIRTILARVLARFDIDILLSEENMTDGPAKA